MYMHTLDRQPACFGHGQDGKPYLYFTGGRSYVRLVGSLATLRAEQRRAIASEQPDSEWANPSRYGYVLVLVPR